jgi:hypothetical protein
MAKPGRKKQKGTNRLIDKVRARRRAENLQALRMLLAISTLIYCSVSWSPERFGADMLEK